MAAWLGCRCEGPVDALGRSSSQGPELCAGALPAEGGGVGLERASCRAWGFPAFAQTTVLWAACARRQARPCLAVGPRWVDLSSTERGQRPPTAPPPQGPTEASREAALSLGMSPTSSRAAPGFPIDFLQCLLST